MPELSQVLNLVRGLTRTPIVGNSHNARFRQGVTMTTRFPRLKKFAGQAVMATAVAAVGLSLGAGTAQASPKHHDPHPHTMTTFNQSVDNFFDGVQRIFRVGEGTPFDNRLDMRFGVS